MGVYLNVYQDADHAAEGDVRLAVVYNNGDLTGTLAGGTCDYPSVNDVRLGIQYADLTLTGNVRIPTADDVRSGLAYETLDSVTGTMDLPSVNDVRLNVQFDGNTETGNVRLPIVGDVRIGVVYDSLDSLTGTLDPAAADYPGVADVRLGVSYSFATLVGTLDLPSADKVRAGVEFDNTTKTGNSVQPPEARVLLATTYGTAGIEFTGTLDPGASGANYPLETQVLVGVQFGDTFEFTGNRTDAAESDVRLGVTYGPNGTLFVGTFTGGSGSPGDPGWIG